MYLSAAIVLFCLLAGVSARGQADAGQPPALVHCTKVEIETPVRGALASDGGGIYVGTTGGTLTAYDSFDRTIRWRSELGGEIISNVLIVGNGVAVVSGTEERSIVRLIGKESGVTVWSVKLPQSDRYYLGLLNGGIGAASQDGTAALLDAGSGRTRWQNGPHGRVTAIPIFGSGRMVFGTAEKLLIAIGQDGNALFKHVLEFEPSTLAFTAENGVLAGDRRGHVVFFTTDNKIFWKFKSGAAVSSVAETDEGVLVTSLDNFVYFLSDYNGDVIWKRRLPGRLVEGGLIVDNYLVVLLYGENSGYAIDMKTGKVFDTLPGIDADLVNRAPVAVREKTFAFTTTASLEIYSIGGCHSTKKGGP